MDLLDICTISCHDVRLRAAQRPTSRSLPRADRVLPAPISAEPKVTLVGLSGVYQREK